MARRWVALALTVIGIGIMAIGYTDPRLILDGTRPYAYISVMAVGAMFTIFGSLIGRDR
jgi:hypothetical protein